jgi:hypothetical protein
MCGYGDTGFREREYRGEIVVLLTETMRMAGEVVGDRPKAGHDTEGVGAVGGLKLSVTGTRLLMT